VNLEKLHSLELFGAALGRCTESDSSEGLFLCTESDFYRAEHLHAPKLFSGAPKKSSELTASFSHHYR
jgi:hypothetical protein